MTPRSTVRLCALGLAASLTACAAPATRPRPIPAEPRRGEQLTQQQILIGDSISYTFGPAAPRDGLTIPEVERRALVAWQDGQEALHVRLYELAEKKFREAVLYDGSDARYHASLGSILLKRGKRTEAEAALSAAVLLDVENPAYRQLLLDTRRPE